ncbi:MAG: histidine phosphatase family protein [Planctomycetes bacterium]|nr:histidine phosphatase family protein [Planctomycetota bacterium]
MTMPLHFVLVRHGESEGNLVRRRERAGDHRGFTEEFRRVHSSQYRLTALGRRQAAGAGTWVRANVGVRFHRYYVSEYIRALETAALLDLPGASWFKTPFLREREAGEFDNLTEAEKERDFARYMLARRNDSYFWKPPNGESMVDVCLRLHRFLDTVHRGHADASVIVVCHANVMQAFRILLERLSQTQFNALANTPNPHERIHNCQVLHYTRQNPADAADVRPHPMWLRSVCPWDLSLSHDGWREIVRSRYTNEDLLREAEGVPRHTPEELEE